MRFDFVFIAFGVLAGAILPLVGAALPSMKALPALLWLLAAILVFDIATALMRGVPVMTAVPTTTRAAAFIGGALALILAGGMWG